MIQARSRALVMDAELLEKELSHEPVDRPQGLATLREACALHVVRVLRACRGNKAKAARVLAVDTKTIYRWLDRVQEGQYETTFRKESVACE